jgi:5'-nucleotidase
MKPVALFDMDGTLVDFDGAMWSDLNQMRAPAEPDHTPTPDDENDPAWLKFRKDMIKRQPNWWVNLPRYAPGFEVYWAARDIGFGISILTKGPYNNSDAWRQKHEWCKKHVPGDTIIMSQDKSLVYGRVLVDDWPPYIEPWLKWRQRGLVIMPAHRWNEGYSHPQVIRYDGTNMVAVREALSAQYNRNL